MNINSLPCLNEDMLKNVESYHRLATLDETKLSTLGQQTRLMVMYSHFEQVLEYNRKQVEYDIGNNHSNAFDEGLKELNQAVKDNT